MSIIDRIAALYPSAVAPMDFLVEDRGYGQYLSAWRISGPLPEGVTMGISALQRFLEMQGTVKASAQTLIRQVSEIEDLLNGNPQVAAATAAAEVGALIDETGMTKEEVLLGISLITSYLAYIDSQLGASGMTIRQAVYRLG
jgi:hypothetical protein